MNLQFFGGRGGSGGKRTESTPRFSGSKVENLRRNQVFTNIRPSDAGDLMAGAPRGMSFSIEGSNVQVQKSTGNKWNVFVGSKMKIISSTKELEDLVVGKDIRIMSPRRLEENGSWGIDQMNRRERAKAREESGANMLKPGDQLAPGYGEMLAERVRRRRKSK